jgi:PhnB protein
MAVASTTHLNFHGTARQALEFYRDTFGGELTIATYGDFGMPAEAPGAEWVIFGQVENATGFRVMAYDIPGADRPSVRPGATSRVNGMTLTDRPFFQSLRADALDELSGYWDALAEGAVIIEPLGASAWSPGFGMLTDRFGVTWVLDVQARQPESTGSETLP